MDSQASDADESKDCQVQAILQSIGPYLGHRDVSACDVQHADRDQCLVDIRNQCGYESRREDSLQEDQVDFLALAPCLMEAGSLASLEIFDVSPLV